MIHGFKKQAGGGSLVKRWTEENPSGLLVEMHGNIREVVCLSCRDKRPIDREQEKAFTAAQPAECAACHVSIIPFCVLFFLLS
jgi:NAD-dependent SIR2 family protein deacetylase